MGSQPQVVRGPSRVAMMPLDADGLPGGPWEDVGALAYLDAVNDDAVVSLDLTPLVRATNEVVATFVLARPQFRALMRALRYRPQPPPLPWSRARMARRRSRR